MSFYQIAQVAAAWSDDRNGAYLLQDDQGSGPLGLWAGVDPVWADFVPAMQVISDSGDDNDGAWWLQYWAVAELAPGQRYMVVWSSHPEGRGPCKVQIMVMGATVSDQVHVSPGPCEGLPSDLLAQLIQSATWQFPGVLPGAE